MKKILAFLYFSFLAVLADEISLERLEQIKKEQNQYWLEFLDDGSSDCIHICERTKRPYECYTHCSAPIKQRHIAFVKKHFTPIWYEITTNDKGQKLAQLTCFDNEAEKFCNYRLKAPIKLKGKLTIKPHYGGLQGCDDLPMQTLFENENLPRFLAYVHLQIKPNSHNQKEVLDKIPQWVLDGFAGKISYEVEFEVANMSGYISDVWSKHHQDIALIADSSACSAGSYLVADKIKFIKKLSEKMDENVKPYLNEYSEQEVYTLSLKTKDDFVNLRESPNGNIVARIYKKDFSDILVVKIQQTKLLGFNQNKKWHKVIYFPPNTRKTKDAKVGFIHQSQLDENENWHFAF